MYSNCRNGATPLWIILCVFGIRSHRCFNRWHRFAPLKSKSMVKVLHIFYLKTNALHQCGNYCTLRLIAAATWNSSQPPRFHGSTPNYGALDFYTGCKNWTNSLCLQLSGWYKPRFLIHCIIVNSMVDYNPCLVQTSGESEKTFLWNPPIQATPPSDPGPHRSLRTALQPPHLQVNHLGSYIIDLAIPQLCSSGSA